MGHSRFSPSATEREYQCPPSFLLSEKFEDDQSTDAAHGTAAHHVAELCLTRGVDVDHYAGCRLAVNPRGRTRFITESKPLGDDELEFEVDDEMIHNVQRYVDWCRELPGEHFVEVKVEHTRWCPDVDENGKKLDPQFGTSDHNACIPAGTGIYRVSTLVITDLKYGRGVQVFAFENKQAIKYALGALDEWNWLYNFEKVIIRICQPRLGHFDTWELTIEELYEWGRKIKERLTLVFDPEAKFGPSDKACKFCKVKPCKPRQDYIFQQRALMMDDEVGEIQVDPNLLSGDDLLAAFRLVPLLEIHISHIRSAVYRQLMQGEDVGDLVLVESVSHRQWDASTAELEERLRKLGVAPNAMWKKTFITPAQAEDVLPKHERHGGKKITKKQRADMLEELVRRPPGSPVVAESGDKRKRWERPAVDLDGLD